MLACTLFLIVFPYIICMKASVVKTTSGYVRGGVVEVNNVCVAQYLNIPYSEPPVASLRFARPVPLISSKNGIINRMSEKISCFQYFGDHNNNTEDCLVLNIWAPISANKSGALKPVMLWIYGGGCQVGSISDAKYNGSALASYEVLVVTINYRIGPFGFLYGGTDSAPGNVGLYDQLMALYWVKNNIRLFGGDPNLVTLFGESAGAWSISAHLISPLARGLFKRAILQSGSILQNKREPYLPISTAYNEARSFANYFNCSGLKWLECLRRVDAKKLNAYYRSTSFLIYGTEYLPLSAQKAFQTNRLNSGVDIIAGVDRDEGSMLARVNWEKSDNLHSVQEFDNLVKGLSNPELIFKSGKITNYALTQLNSKAIIAFYLKNVNTSNTTALQNAFWEFYGDVLIKCPTYIFVKLFAELSPKRNVFFYEFTWSMPDQMCTEGMGVCHGSEIDYVFGVPVLSNRSDKRFSRYVMKLWTNFAKYGNPTAGFPPKYQWPPFKRSGKYIFPTKTKEINPIRLNHTIDNLYANNCDGFWKNYFI